MYLDQAAAPLVLDGLSRYLCSWQDVYAQMESFACRTYQTCPGLGFVLLKTETAKIDCKTTML